MWPPFSLTWPSCDGSRVVMNAATHLDALNLRLSHERGYLAKAKTVGERELRAVWIVQIEREIARERAFLGLGNAVSAPEMTDDELLAALAG